MIIDQEQLFRAHDSAPQVIRDALRPSGIASAFIFAAGSRYNLHVDVTGKLGVLVRDMLLGLLPPANFVHELELAGMTSDAARALTAELNKEVFMPLRDKVRSAENVERIISTAKKPLPPVEKPVETKSPEVTEPKPVPTNTVSEKKVDEIKEVVQIPISITASELSKQPVQVATPIQPKENIPTLQPVVRTMAHDMDVLQHSGQTPAPIPFVPSTPLSSPSQMTAARTFQTASVPFTNTYSTPPEPTPIPIDEVKQVEPIEKRPIQSVYQPQKTQVTQVSSDPYREPI